MIDGHLLYDYHGANDLARMYLEIKKEAHISRRFFYWISKEGQRVLLVHAIDACHLQLPGQKRIYKSQAELYSELRLMLSGVKKVAMEYSPLANLVQTSKVDAGTVDLIRSLGIEVVSSDPFIQPKLCCLSLKQKEDHRYAFSVIEIALQKVQEAISKNLGKITEWDVVELIRKTFDLYHCIAEHGPCCAVNAHAAIPHYAPEKNSAALIRKNDLILVDLWCKKDQEDAPYADVTRVFFASNKAEEEIAHVFAIVRKAQAEAMDFIKKSIAEGKEVLGFEVDQKARSLIERSGFKEQFVHRTGHNIHTSVHGPGTNFDSLETWDDRMIYPDCCFSVEPGIYLENKFGIRLEDNILVHADGTVECTTKGQNQLILLN